VKNYKYIVEFPKSFEANTLDEIIERTGWSKGTIQRILNGNSRIPVEIRRSGKPSSIMNKFRAKNTKTPNDELPLGSGNIKTIRED
jgi:hypothetical protein